MSLQTFDELRDELQRRLKTGSTTEEISKCGTVLNSALNNMHISPGHKFPWAERRSTLVTHAPYLTGTISISDAARTTVTGVGTLWNTAVTGFGFNNARAGGKMVFPGVMEPYEVQTVNSDTSITLTSRFVGDAVTDVSYYYIEDEYALATDFLRPIDLQMFSDAANIQIVGRTEFRRNVPRNDQRARPRVATFWQTSFATTTAPQHRVALFPVPDDEYSIPYWYVTSNLAVTSNGVEQPLMVNDTDEPIVPIMYREALIFYAQSLYFRDYKDDLDRAGILMGHYNDMMTRFSGENTADRPRMIATLRGGTKLDPRFDTGNRFDTLRDRGWR